MKRAASILIALLVAGSPVLAQGEDDDDDEDTVLGSVVTNAPITLEQGFMASKGEGTPISGKFELEVDGAQLSVYTAKGDAYSEVIVDHRNGTVAKVIPITDGKALDDAKKQMDAMRGAQRSLEEATVRALKTQQGYRAVSATPGRKDGAALLKVLLTNGSEWKTVYEPLKGDE